jgi:serine/threonine protein kinase
MSFEKAVYGPELLFTLKAAEYGIAPQVLEWKHYYGDEFDMVLRKYQYTLDDLPQRYWGSVTLKVTDLINLLHRIGIFHGDISLSNIVVNPDSEDVKLIDFGASIWIKDLESPEVLQDTYENYYPKFLIKNRGTIQDVVNAELQHWRAISKLS